MNSVTILNYSLNGIFITPLTAAKHRRTSLKPWTAVFLKKPILYLFGFHYAPQFTNVIIYAKPNFDRGQGVSICQVPKNRRFSLSVKWPIS